MKANVINMQTEIDMETAARIRNLSDDELVFIFQKGVANLKSEGVANLAKWGVANPQEDEV